MPHAPSQSSIAGASRRAPARGPDAGRGRTPADEVRSLSDDLDQLLRLESLEARSAAEVERKIALVEKLAAGFCGLRQHYRGRAERPCRPPAFVSPDGRKAGW